MKAWVFPILVIFIVIISLSLIYFNPDFFAPPKLISPLADPATPVADTVVPTKNPLSTISTPMPVLIETPKPTIQKADTGGITSITLTANKTASDAAKLLWTIDGATQTGFAVLTSTASAPTYPPRLGDQARTVSDPAAREFILNNLSGKFFLRLCELVQNSCGTFSNQISLEF